MEKMKIGESKDGLMERLRACSIEMEQRIWKGLKIKACFEILLDMDIF